MGLCGFWYKPLHPALRIVHFPGQEKEIIRRRLDQLIIKINSPSCLQITKPCIANNESHVVIKMSIKMHPRGNLNLPQYIHLVHESQNSEPGAISILTIRAKKWPKVFKLSWRSWHSAFWSELKCRSRSYLRCKDKNFPLHKYKWVSICCVAIMGCQTLSNR